jgi:thiol:disulfide interchange protein DsbD
MKKLLVIVFAVLGTAFSGKAQLEDPVKWTYGAKRLSATEAVLFIKATIDQGWHIYSQKTPSGGPVKTTFTFNPSKTYTLSGITSEPKPIKKFEKTFGIDVSYFEDEVIFQQKIKLKSSAATTVTGKLEYMTCDDHKCLPPFDDVKFSIPVKALGK